VKRVKFKDFSADEHRVWKLLFDRQTPKRSQQIVPIFAQGLEKLGITHERIPDLSQVNQRLRALTGWEGIPVEGLEDGQSFYAMLADRQFPIGNFIRDERDLSYTPAPDVFHDLYGHLPFYADPDYARFCEAYGKEAVKFSDDAVILREFERFFWFTIEFGLIETPAGRRIFGAGIASSFGECEYALSEKPEIVPFSVESLRAQEFRIDVFQERLFLLKSESQLYESLQQFVKIYESSYHRAV